MLADMAEDERRNTGVEIVLNKIGCNFIREVPAAAHHTLLHRPGIRTHAQHFEIVIGFQNKQIRSAEVHAKRIGDITQIGGNRHLDPLCREGEPDGVHCIVRDGEACHIEIPDTKGVPSLKAFECGRAFGPVDELSGTMRQVDGDTIFEAFCESGQAAGVIGMFVRDQDGIELAKIFADERQAFGDLAAAQTGIDQDTGAAGG